MIWRQWKNSKAVGKTGPGLRVREKQWGGRYITVKCTRGPNCKYMYFIGELNQLLSVGNKGGR
jgi:hypothetical protein